MNDDTDECQTCTRTERVGRYLLLRAKEPTTWAGITLAATAFGIHLSPDQIVAIGTIGAGIASVLLVFSKEGRNKPDNPSLTATITGSMPPSKPAIVPPAATTETVAIDPQRVPVDAAGELQAPK
jgi:hypothetical protein